MRVCDFILNDHFDANLNFAIYEGIWNDGGICLWDTKEKDRSDIPASILVKQISYMTIDIQNSMLVIEVNDGEKKENTPDRPHLEAVKHEPVCDKTVKPIKRKPICRTDIQKDEIVFTYSTRDGHFLDVGLCIEAKQGLPTRILSRHSEYSPDCEFGGVSCVTWIGSNTFTTKEEWNKNTNQSMSPYDVMEVWGINKKLLEKKAKLMKGR